MKTDTNPQESLTEIQSAIERTKAEHAAHVSALEKRREEISANERPLWLLLEERRLLVELIDTVKGHEAFYQANDAEYREKLQAVIGNPNGDPGRYLHNIAGLFPHLAHAARFAKECGVWLENAQAKLPTLDAQIRETTKARKLQHLLPAALAHLA